jgi:plasmid stabilization system protein ParE
MADFDIDHIFAYHLPTDAQANAYAFIRSQAKEFARTLLRHTPEGADQSAALRLLREAVMTANAAIALEGRLYEKTDELDDEPKAMNGAEVIPLEYVRKAERVIARRWHGSSEEAHAIVQWVTTLNGKASYRIGGPIQIHGGTGAIVPLRPSEWVTYETDENGVASLSRGMYTGGFRVMTDANFRAQYEETP